MTWDEWVMAVVTLGLAGYAVAGLWRRTVRTRSAYGVGLIVGAGLGVLVLGWPEGLVIGLGASGIGPDVVRHGRARLGAAKRHKGD